MEESLCFRKICCFLTFTKSSYYVGSRSRLLYVGTCAPEYKGLGFCRRIYSSYSLQPAMGWSLLTHHSDDGSSNLCSRCGSSRKIPWPQALPSWMIFSSACFMQPHVNAHAPTFNAHSHVNTTCSFFIFLY